MMLTARFFLPFLQVLTSSAAAAVSSSTTVSTRASNQTHACRYIPGDEGWPSKIHWEQLNDTVGGRLIATVPVAHVCHQSGPFAAYDQTTCEDLATAFQDAGPETMLVSFNVP